MARRSSRNRSKPARASTSKRFVRGEIKPTLGEIRVKKTDEGVAWGSVHWQYLEDMSQGHVPRRHAAEAGKSSVRQTAYTASGPVLETVDGPVQVGDELVVRIVLRTDRDMEYVHLKDYRGSGTEPVNVLSRYKYQDGLDYYESTKDTASHFFIDYLPKGTYVFEYSVRVQLQGQVPNRHRADPVHVRPRVQQPLGEHRTGGEVARHRTVGGDYSTTGIPIGNAVKHFGGRICRASRLWPFAAIET